MDEKSSEFRDNFKLSVNSLKPSDKKIIGKALRKHFLFKQLSKQDLTMIYEKMKLCHLLADEIIYDQNSIGSKFFIIRSGKLEVLKDGKQVRVLSKGDTFGEMALVTMSKRRETVQTLGNTSIWSLSRSSFKQALKFIFSKNFDSNREFISKVRLFSNSADSQKDALTRLAILHEYKEGDVIIREGDEGDLLFIIKVGKINFIQGQQVLFYMSSGDIFGEGSLLTGSHRGVTAVALENSKLLSLDKAALVSVFGENFKEVIFKNIAKNSILSDTYLEFLSKENIITLVESLEWTQYSAGQVVIPEEYDKKSRFFVICSGEIVSTPSKHTIKSYSVVGLQNFNERSILQEQYIAEIDTIIGEINAASIEKMLNLAIDTIFQEADSIKILKNISIFKYLSLSKLKSLSSKLYLEEFEKKEIIFNFKESAKTLYIIKDGSVEIFNDGKVLRTLGKFDIFGERCLGETTRSASARASIRTECWVLDVEDLKALMEESITMEIERKKYYQADVMLNNLLFVQTIHKRSDRQMHITFYDRHNAYYNVQVISKSKFITIEQCMSLVQEKQINLQLDHHFIIKLVKTFTDQAQVYFVTEHIDGVILREIMKPILKENYINFLFSCIVTIIEYLHDKNIIYRDLCPENIMINRFGQPYLFNFSASKIVKGRTYTTIGNPYYRSPEIMIGRGYSKSTDYWSLGVILYEILYGYLPFDISYNDDPATSYEKIINNKVKFSTNPQYLLPNDLIQELLVDDTQRIQADGIKKHPWLSTIDWDMLSRPSSTSCFSPKIPILKLKPMSNMITLERYLNEELSLNQKTRDKKISNFAFRWEKYF